MFFTTDFNKVLQIEDTKEYLEGVHSEIMPILESMIKSAAERIKEEFGVDVFETMKIWRHPNPRPNAKTLRSKYNQEDRYVSCDLSGKTLKDGYPNLAYDRLWKMSPSCLGFIETGEYFEVQFDPFHTGRHDDKFVALTERFFRDNWIVLRDELPFIVDYKTGERVECAKIDDVGKYIHNADGFTAMTFVTGGIELKDIHDLQDLEEADDEQILRIFVEYIVALYPFLHACICLAKGEPTDGFFVMLEQCKKSRNGEDAQFDKTEITDTIEESHDSADGSKDVLTEGAVVRTFGNRYERNHKARLQCVAKQGYTCVVCGFNFEKRYGEIGKNFVHVHHLKDVAGRGGEYEINPDTDLRPVCPNCHAMLHKGKTPLSPEELKQMLRDNLNGWKEYLAESDPP